MANIRIKEIPVEEFAILMVDKPKTECGENTANAGYFGVFGSEGYTLPAGHLICDYAADSPNTRASCEERGEFKGEKFYFDSSTWSYENEFYGKAVSTLLVRDGKAWIEDVLTLPEADYAIAGVPVVRNGGDCKFTAYVTKQGWGGGSLYATWHNFVGVKDDPGTVYLISMKTTTGNMVKTSEAYNALKPLGFRDVIKVDGGKSFYADYDGVRSDTGGNRRLNTIFTFGRKVASNGDPVARIALDAGHGANTAGRRCLKSLDPNETREWQLNDRICDKIENKLRAYEGYELLRLDDSDDGADDVSLANRVDAANAWGADFYLSIHHNAGINGGSGGGIVAYAYTKAQAASLEWRDELYGALIAKTGLKGNRATPKAVANHYVTRETTCPATLLELGFMDSKTDVPIILTDEYAEQCAEAIVKVMVRRFGLEKKSAIDSADSWATEAWSRAAEAGVLDGTRPRDPVTRQELAVVLAKLNLI